MRIWRVQWAYGMGIGEPSTHKDEETAKAEVAYWLEDWLLKMLRGSADFNEEMGQHLDYVADARATEAEIRRWLSNGDVWAANDLWHDFLDRWEGTWTYPMWVKLGMVIVDTREAEPLRKRRTLPPTIPGEPPPYFQYDPGEGAILGPGEAIADPKFMEELKKMRQIEPPPGAPGGSSGPSMGAFKVWQVTETDTRGTLHPSTYRDEELAAAHVARNLRFFAMQIDHAFRIWERQAASGLIKADRDFFDRLSDAVAVMGIDLDLEFLDYKRVWSAYATWKDFEKKYGAGIVPPIWERVGTVEVIEH